MKRVSIGGQAVLEGIMMKGPDSYALSVRKTDHEIEVITTPYISFGERSKLGQIPIVRGVINFIESLYIGMSTLMKSAEYFEDEEEDASKSEETKKKESDKGYLILTLIVSLVFAIGLFVLLPSFLANFLYKVTSSDLLVNAAEGVLRMIIFLLYIYFVSKMKDIRRTYMYHGAEHKTINCMEAGMDLTVENVKKASRFHRRCGTSFLFIVMIISILVFMFIKTDVMWLRLLSRLLLIPVIAGISYEFLRYAGKHDNKCSRMLSWPGVMLQRLTTIEPEDDMIEVAIRSVEAVMDWKEYVKCVREDSFEK